MALLGCEWDAGGEVDEAQALAYLWAFDFASVGLDHEGGYVGGFEVSVLYSLNAVDLEADVVEVVVVGVGEFAEVEGYALACLAEGAGEGDGLPLGGEGYVAQCLVVDVGAWGIVYLCGCVGCLVGSHVG